MNLMAEFYQPTSRALERIGVFGTPGVGKSKGIYQIAEKVDPTKVTIWIIETDNSVDEFLESYSHLGVREEYVKNRLDDTYCRSDGHLVVFRARNWNEYKWAMEQVWKRAERNDWVAIDNITWFWSKVQSWYVETVYGMEIEEFLLKERQKQVKKGDTNHTAMEGMFTDWGAINPEYFSVVRDRFMSPVCHMYVTANLKKIDDKQMNKDKNLKNLYGGLGVMPEGQKLFGHDVRTLLLLSKDSRFGEDTHKYTSLKDRERERQDDREWGDFVLDYLVPVGKWSAVSTTPPIGKTVSKVSKAVTKGVVKK